MKSFSQIASAVLVAGLIALASCEQPTTEILVQSISVAGVGNATTVTELDGTLVLTATVSPSNANNRSVSWSVTDGTGSATVSTSGLLTALADGTVTVTAQARDGSGKSGELEITISGQYSSGLLARYTFDNGSVDDRSGNGRHATLTGASVTTDRNGSAGDAYDFSANTQHISIPELSSLTSLTATLWVRSSGTQGTYAYPLNTRTWNTSPAGLIYAGYQSSRTAVDVYGNLPLTAQSVGLSPTNVSWVQTGVWHHLAVVFDTLGKTAALYVDGAAVDNATFTTFPSTLSPRFELGGYFNSTNTRNWLGAIDDVRFYDRVLSGTELANLYAAEAP